MVIYSHFLWEVGRKMLTATFRLSLYHRGHLDCWRAMEMSGRLKPVAGAKLWREQMKAEGWYQDAKPVSSWKRPCARPGLTRSVWMYMDAVLYDSVSQTFFSHYLLWWHKSHSALSWHGSHKVSCCCVLGIGLLATYFHVKHGLVWVLIINQSIQSYIALL